jgi:hypothetical protein
MIYALPVVALGLKRFKEQQCTVCGFYTTENVAVIAICILLSCCVVRAVLSTRQQQDLYTRRICDAAQLRDAR